MAINNLMAVGAISDCMLIRVDIEKPMISAKKGLLEFATR